MKKNILLLVLLAGFFASAFAQKKDSVKVDSVVVDKAKQPKDKEVRIVRGLHNIPKYESKDAEKKINYKGIVLKDSITFNPNSIPVSRRDTLPLLKDSGIKTGSKTSGSQRTMSVQQNSMQTFTVPVDAGRTQGSLDVSPSGAANYSIPIAVPPGIAGVVPQVALTYNSQGGNGVAGYGWNIAGLSAITRIASTKFHDDYVGGVNFDSHDRFALDGQRLILKSGVYGGDGAEYQTESYSNIRIVSRGVSGYGAAYGPQYFEVYYPDGSKAFYGYSYDSTSPTDFAISYTENPQGIRISYSYYQDINNLLTINQIKYGSKGTASPLNSITFTYKNRQRNEQGYVGGQSFVQTRILSEISVVANGTSFRNYVLSHNQIQSLKYERLISIQEFDGAKTKSFEPINFQYTDTNSLIEVSAINNLSVGGITSDNSQVLTADFTGNGKMDFIVYPNAKNKIWAFWDPTGGSPYYQMGYQVNTGYFNTIIPMTWLTHNNKVLTGQGFSLIKHLGVSATKFEVYSAGTVSPVYYQYEKLWDAPTTGEFYSGCSQTTEPGRMMDREYLSGDFNGDGLTDVLSVTRPYWQVTSTSIDPNCTDEDPFYCCLAEMVFHDVSPVHFINLDRRVTSNFVNSAGSLLNSLGNDDKIYTTDFNGNGKADIIHITAGIMYVYELDSTNNLVLLKQKTDSRVTISYPSLLGDYNGDGKTDVIFPTPHVSSGDDLFAVFMSTGTDFDKTEKTYPFPNYSNLWDPYEQELWLFNLIANDVNGDGKTDIIWTQTNTFNNNNSQGDIHVSFFGNIGAATGSTAPDFVRDSYINHDNVHLIHYPTPLFLTPDKPNLSLEFGIMSDNAIHLFRPLKDVRAEVQVNSVSQDGVTHFIDYKKLIPETNYSYEPSVYEQGYNQVFPFIDIELAPGLKVVNRIRRSFNGTETKQVFAYRGAVSNTEGLGFLGFSEVIRSNWYGSDTDNNRLFSFSIHNPHLRGAVTKQFTSRYASVSSGVSAVNPAQPFITLSTPVTTAQTVTASQSITLLPGFEANGSNGTFIAKISDPANPITDGAAITDYITRTDYTYDTQTLSNKVFINKVTSTVTKDLLSGTATTAAFTYDSYNNVTKEVTNFSGAGTKTVDIIYDNNPTGGYIGRPLTKKTKLNNSGDTYTTEEEYSYTGFLPAQVKRKGHNTPFITENLQYDTFGNVTQKSATAGSSTRTSQMQYDASGRFVTKTIDAEGLETTFQYNTSTGNLTSKTDPYNLSTTYLYDVWGRAVQATNFLGKSSYTAYQKDESTIFITQVSEEGSWSKKSVNALGQTKLVRALDVLGQIVDKSFDYDIYDRPTGESEPSTSGSFSQWNTTEYDEYGRVKKNTSYTGKITTIGYNGLITTVNDGTKTVTTTKNALGNVVTVTDPGGTITNTYFANGNLKSAGFEGSTQSIEQDGWGRKTKLTDPSAGVYTYTYNDFGEVLTEGTPKGVTTYTYDTNGKQLSKQIQGDATGMTYQYNYDGTTKLLTSTGLTNTDGNNTTYTYTYDNYKRINSTVEDNLHARFTKTLSFDSFGRVATETSEAKNKQNNKIASRTILNTYQNGELKSITDNTTSEKIWEVSALNARGQVTTALLGSTMKQTNAYDQYGYATELKTERLGSNPAVLMQLGYSFDPQRGNLNSRSNSAFSWSETFGYDSQDRLTTFNDNNANHSQSYDNRGRINNNSAIGNYVFDGISYQQTGLTSPTPAATWHYHNRPLQEISYNAFKSPVEIKEQGKERISFQYNGGQGRSHMYYGDEQADKLNRRYRRHYSEDGSMEITEDLTGNTTSFVFNMGGDAYDAPALWKEVHSSTGTTQNLYYLHRDHLGSITLITDNQGTAVEKRQFDAWGNIVKLTDGNGNDLVTFLITDRGYTGHEHLVGVALIHMNGRLYDPKLHRFLQPDNFVQDPSNSQSFNRYGYVMNNPLSRIDKDGEFWHLVIGAAIGGIVNWVSHGAKFNAKGLAHFGVGALAGGLSAGIGAGVNVSMAGGSFGAGFMGTAAGVASTGFIAGAATGAAAGFTNGFLTGVGNTAISGGSLGQSLSAGFKSGFGQALAGGVMGGVIGGIKAASKGLDFFTGKGTFSTADAIGCSGDIPDLDEIRGKYAGNFHGADVYETNQLHGTEGMTLPGKGIFVPKGVYSLNNDYNLMRHEYGHILQSKLIGKANWYTKVGPLSLWSASSAPTTHNSFWTEVWANNLSFDYFMSMPKSPLWSFDYPLLYRNLTDLWIVKALTK